MIATIRSATILGARGHPVNVEVHVAKGMPGFTMLGLPDESCREARDRVRAAIITSGFGWSDKKITVNLAPPSYRKTGSGLDLPIARDTALALVKKTGVSVTPEVAVIDAQGEMAYRGRVDDRYVDFGVDRPAPTTRDLDHARECTTRGFVTLARRG